MSYSPMNELRIYTQHREVEFCYSPRQQRLDVTTFQPDGSLGDKYTFTLEELIQCWEFLGEIVKENIQHKKEREKSKKKRDSVPRFR